MPDAQSRRPLATPRSERQPSRDTVPFEAFDPTHPDHAWFIGDDPARCRADKPCPVCDPPAVRALREANCQSAPSSSQAGSSTAHTCCEHCTNRTGSCVRCGVRDAEAWELCGPCDREVEAEATGRALREADQ